MKKAPFFFTALFILFSACATRLQFRPNENRVVQKGVIALSVNWIKDKGKKFDIELRVENVSNKPILFYLKDMGCARGFTRGTLKHTFFNTGERTIDFGSHEIKTFRLVCNIGSQSEGPYTMRVRRIYNNPSGDGRTQGALLSNEVVWSHVIAK